MTLAQLPVGLCFTPQTGIGWSVSRSDIGLVSARAGPVTRSSLAVVAGHGQVVPATGRHVIVVTSGDLLVELAGVGQKSSGRLPGSRTGPPEPRAGGRETVTKNFLRVGFESRAGRENHLTCVVPNRVPGPGRCGAHRDRPGGPGRFDGVLIAV